MSQRSKSESILFLLDANLYTEENLNPARWQNDTTKLEDHEYTSSPGCSVNQMIVRVRTSFQVVCSSFRFLPLKPALVVIEFQQNVFIISESNLFIRLGQGCGPDPADFVGSGFSLVL